MKQQNTQSELFVIAKLHKIIQDLNLLRELEENIKQEETEKK